MPLHIKHSISKIYKLDYDKGSAEAIVLICIQMIILFILPIFIMVCNYLILSDQKENLMMVTEIASYKVINDLEIQALSSRNTIASQDVTASFETYFKLNFRTLKNGNIKNLSAVVEDDKLYIYYEYIVEMPFIKTLICNQIYEIPKGY